MVAKAIYWSSLYKLALLDMEAVFHQALPRSRGRLRGRDGREGRDLVSRSVEPEIAPRRAGRDRAPPAARHTVVLATGSTVYAARSGRPRGRHRPRARDRASRSASDGDAFTGRPSALCFGHHKVALAERWAAAHGVDLARSYFYSDSYNDLPMLARVGTAIAVNPDARLAREARRRAWPVQHWHRSRPVDFARSIDARSV